MFPGSATARRLTGLGGTSVAVLLELLARSTNGDGVLTADVHVLRSGSAGGLCASLQLMLLLVYGTAPPKQRAKLPANGSAP